MTTRDAGGHASAAPGDGASPATTGQIVALVVGDGDATYEIALQAAARGVRLVLVGARERVIAERVGEIAFGGGGARHVAGDLARPETIRDALAKADATFGPARLALVDAAESAALTHLAELAPEVRRLVLTGEDDTSIVLSKVFEAS